MPHAENSVTVAQPIAKVFDFLADGANNAKWRSAVLEISRSSGDGGIGTTYAQTLKGPGSKPIKGDYAITVFEKPIKLGFQVIAGPVRPTGIFQLQELSNNQTELKFALDFKPRGLMILMSPMISKTMKSEVSLLEKLKAELEGKTG